VIIGSVLPSIKKKTNEVSEQDFTMKTLEEKSI
jgi:hypothetical protein